MKTSHLLRTALCALACCQAALAAGRPEVKVELFTFADVVKNVPVRPQWSWHAIGIDPDDNVYALFGGPSGEVADCVLVQYQARTGQRRFLGLLSDAAKAAGTYRPGESFDKGHTRLLWQNGKIYFGTMGFHDAAGAGTGNYMKRALATHGAHLMAYDPKTDKIEDLSHDQPDGVFYPGRGFMTLSMMPERNLVIGFTVPHGDLMFYDTVARNVHRRVPGVPEEFGYHVSREIVPTADGKVYYAYTPAGAKKGPGHMYVYDLETGRRSEKPVEVDRDFWNSLARTRDGKGIYLSDIRGAVFQLHPETGALEKIGRLFDEKSEPEQFEDEKFSYGRLVFSGTAMSADEKYLYAVPQRAHFAKDKPQDKGGKSLGWIIQGVYAFDLKTRRAQRIAPWPENIGHGHITGIDVRDSRGNIYFARHGGAADSYGIVKIGVTDSGTAAAQSASGSP